MEALQNAIEAATEFLENHVVNMTLEAPRLSNPSSSDVRGVPYLKGDGSNLAWMVKRLQGHAANFDAWLEHLRTVIKDVDCIRVVRREEDRKAYLVVSQGNVDVRSFFVSDGLLRLMALSLPAYLHAQTGQLLMVEEPENSMHPLAIEAAYQSLSSVYDSHVLVATHSSLFLGCVEREAVLFFTQDSQGATRIIRGCDHPNLPKPYSKADNDLFFARDVL